jgi:hypothetical protein
MDFVAKTQVSLTKEVSHASLRQLRPEGAGRFSLDLAAHLTKPVDLQLLRKTFWSLWVEGAGDIENKRA